MPAFQGADPDEEILEAAIGALVGEDAGDLVVVIVQLFGGKAHHERLAEIEVVRTGKLEIFGSISVS